jgi:hypothetical protein
MKDNNAKLKLLEKRRQSLRKKLSDISDQISELVEIKYLPEYTKRYVDTYWVNKNNHDKGNTYPIYIHVRAVKDIWDTGGHGINCTLVYDSFQHIEHDKLIIFFDKEEYFNYLGKKITKLAYEKAKQALFEKLTNRL